jgi:hypothetical protein
VVRAAGRTGQAVQRYTPNPCFSGTDTFGYSDSVLAQTGVVTVHILPGACNVAVRRSATDCPHRTVTYTATNPYGLPVRLEVAGQNGPSDTREFTFRIAETGHALRTDTVHFPCPAPPAHGAAGSGSTSSTPPGGLANTGTPTAESAAVGVGAVVLGLGLTLAGTRRRRAG